MKKNNAPGPTDSQSIERTPDFTASKLSTTQTTKLEKTIEFLEEQQLQFAYEQTAMSEARFSRFLEELLEVMKDSETEDD